jgi:hypothetical protein
MLMMQPRPPYVQFSRRAVEARRPALLPDGRSNPEAGQIFWKDADFVTITQTGGKDKVEKEVGPWLENCKIAVQADRMPREWLMAYELGYEAWKKQQEAPIQGTPIRNWPLLTPAQIENMTRLNVLAVEDLATANEQTLAGIGIGARELKQKAIDWLSMKQNEGPVIEQLNSFRINFEELQKQVRDLQERNERLERDNSVLQRRPYNGQSEPPMAADPLSQLAAARSGGPDNDFNDIKLDGEA